MKLTLTLDLDGDAFATISELWRNGNELAYVFETLANEYSNSNVTFGTDSILDSNGNRCGTLVISED